MNLLSGPGPVPKRLRRAGQGPARRVEFGGAGLVQLRRQHLRAHALVAALHRGGVLSLALGGRLLVELACAKLREEAGFFDRALEAAESHVERLVFLDSDNRHWADWSCGVD